MVGVIVSASTAHAVEPTFPLPAPPLELISDHDAFKRFTQEMQQAVDRLLATENSDWGEQRKRLLNLRVHLALCVGQDDVALQTVDRLRDLQTDPGERAHSGVLTQALVASKRNPVALARLLRASLAALPRTPAVHAAVARSAGRIEALSESAIVAEIRDDVAPKVARGEPCTVEMADQIIRAGHRLRNILPLRSAILQAYQATLAEWR